MPQGDAVDAESSSRDGAGLFNTTPGKAGEDNGNNTTQHASPTRSTKSSQRLHQSQELTPPPLPPRPPTSHAGSLRLSKQSSRPQLLSPPTTALSSTNVHSVTRGDHESVQSSPTTGKALSRKHSFTYFARLPGSGSEGDDSASIKSSMPTLDARVDNESILGDVAGGETSPAWKALSAQVERDDPFELLSPEDEALSEQVQHEFDEVEADESKGLTEDDVATIWKSKLKHFFILSASGKPIYSRHGDDKLISHYVGVAQTLISFYQDAKDPLKGFTAGGTRFVMLSKGPLNLVAISRLPESDSQLRSQLEALYMQILSTLTLPSMEKMFKQRASTDLRRPLQGTDALLDGLADGFTRGSPSTLLSALECLRLRNTHRRVINNTLLKVRTQNLLYGLIVAAGRLVSVVRPKKHSLHPGDLHLIFNMLFEAGSVRAGGGENWIPLCLPGFNNTGFLYMYVSFFSTSEEAKEPAEDEDRDEELAIVLISANKEAFYEMRKMRDELVSQLESNGRMSTIKTAIRRGHAPTSSIVPGTVLRHFLYKSRGNVQFVMPSFEPHFGGLVNRRRLMSLYHQMHELIHSRTAHLKVQHSIASDSTSLAWETPLFELYCVAGPNATRAELAQGANKVVQWIRREQERVFIIGGAVF
ncbi:Vacuolar fusion protein MON1 [Fulvia fulva]|uniref:Vacuolar fusion protein MON1 n=1 Tax=Passalora fulva TaxID=5499 RepID=A0A9Q8PJW4_PASFU|nr:Vacuolar fusion protein MON1 [Fulvia fulva]KAK4612828.1 Vacuolar fusion protein MON1 [Fulvia fulva]UJO23835.1 Vacuolar fusion protein MON1 [Fulvia fulva]